jgi:hypothetical protein
MFFIPLWQIIAFSVSLCLWVSLCAHRRDGILPEWHRPTDTVDHLDPQVVEHTEAFVWELLQEIDGKG